MYSELSETVLRYAQAKTAKRPEDSVPLRCISATSTRTLNICASAPLREHIAICPPRSRRIGSRGDAEVLRSGRDEAVPMPSVVRLNNSQPDSSIVSKFSAAPRLRVNKFFALRSQVMTDDFVHAKAQRREDVVLRLASICLRRPRKNRRRLIVHEVMKVSRIASPSRLCAFA